jgi:hypothetical protein
MASSLASTLAVPGAAFHGSAAVASPFLGAPFNQLPTRGASNCRACARKPMLAAAVGGSSSESVVEDAKPSTSSSAEVHCVDFFSRIRGYGGFVRECFGSV